MSQGPIKVNLGSFVQMFPLWLNMDLVDLSEKAAAVGMVFVPYDVRKPMPFKTEEVHAFYSCHMFEHLNPFYDLLPLLKEIRRSLKTGGVLRVVLPDLKKLVEGYQKNDWSWLSQEAQPEKFKSLKSGALKFSMIAYGGDSPAYSRENWGGHMGMYDVEGFIEMLTLAGFKEGNAKEVPLNKSEHAFLKDDYQNRRVYDMWPDHSFAVEVTK